MTLTTILLADSGDDDERAYVGAFLMLSESPRVVAHKLSSGHQSHGSLDDPRPGDREHESNLPGKG